MKTRRWFSLSLATAALVLGQAAFAHGGQPHFKGTVKTIDDKTLTVVTGENKEETFRVDEDTKFEKGGVTASAKDLQPGARVVVHATKSRGSLLALVVKVGRPVAKPHDHGHQEHKARDAASQSQEEDAGTPPGDAHAH